MATTQAISETNLPGLKLACRGKVRDNYDFDGKFLLVATDRVSVYDVVLPTPIPLKGAVLTQLSAFWFGKTRGLIENHMITADFDEFPPQLKAFPVLAGRSMLAVKAEPLPVEWVVRGYLAGSAWSEYKETGSVCGIQLPEGLVESDALPEPILTPATKAETGHDENISEARAAEIVGKDVVAELKEAAISLYTFASQYARKRGIIIADTKFEFGRLGDGHVLIDEALTPDSSRFWPADGYSPGRPQESFDKQFVRDYSTGTGWDKTYPGPELPQDVVDYTARKYVDAFEMITGSKLAV